MAFKSLYQKYRRLVIFDTETTGLDYKKDQIIWSEGDRVAHIGIVLTGAVQTFTDNCVVGITANAERCRELVDGSVGVITAICPTLGYAESADIAKTAIKTGESVREVLRSKNIMSEEEIDKLLDPSTMV